MLIQHKVSVLKYVILAGYCIAWFLTRRLNEQIEFSFALLAQNSSAISMDEMPSVMGRSLRAKIALNVVKTAINIIFTVFEGIVTHLKCILFRVT